MTTVKEIKTIKNRITKKRSELLELCDELNDILQAINSCTDYLRLGLKYIQKGIDDLTYSEEKL